MPLARRSYRVFKRLIIVSALACALALAWAAPAFAWANGGPSPNNYGTHDWILDNARRVAGADGLWVKRQTALYATDDPDFNSERTDTYHLFHESGLRRGAVQKVADYYYLAVRAYRSGDMTAASTYVGRMSHFYADILNPYHSTYAARSQTTVHLEYERDFDAYTRTSTALRSWITYRTPVRVTDVRKRAVSAAAYSRHYHALLHRSFSSTHRITGTTTTITRYMMNRAVNDLADIIRSIPDAAGLAQAPAEITARSSYPFPALYGTTGAFFTCVDASGTPIEGARVIISWPRPDGTVTNVTAYTDRYGVAHDYENVGASPVLRKMVVTARQYTSGRSVAGETWYMTTPALADGAGVGIEVQADHRYAANDTTVTAYTICRNTSLKPVAGMPVKFSVMRRYDDGSLSAAFETYETFTGTDGTAYFRWNTGSDRTGQTLYIRGETVAAGKTRATGRYVTVQGD